jgi:hypothetical protein
MKIIKQGNPEYLKQLTKIARIKFVCDKCDCEFVCDSDERCVIDNMGQNGHARGVH